MSIGERLRTLEDEAIDLSSWLAPIEIRQEADGEPTQVVNRMTREEQPQPLIKPPHPSKLHASACAASREKF